MALGGCRFGVVVIVCRLEGFRLQGCDSFSLGYWAFGEDFVATRGKA